MKDDHSHYLSSILTLLSDPTSERPEGNPDPRAYLALGALDALLIAAAQYQGG